ncbi:MAG TPA: hypothetical protein VD913_06335 [bacterium]|nr:hypothetical protein [bacterium]
MPRDAFGFQFWLKWIFWFAGSLILAALFWTVLLAQVFGKIQGTELTLAWAIAVFGSWFLLVIPFMRKKERIWKRINQDQEKAIDAWLAAMGLFIGLLIVSIVSWTWIYRESLDRAPGLNKDWAKAVFSTWLFLLLPFLVWMYKRTDQIYKSAVKRQTALKPPFRTIFIERSKRLLPESIVKKLKRLPLTVEKGQLITLHLRNGSQIPHVFVLNCSEILGVYERDTIDFENEDIVDVEPVAGMLRYEESKWLRLDGRA